MRCFLHNQIHGYACATTCLFRGWDLDITSSLNFDIPSSNDLTCTSVHSMVQFVFSGWSPRLGVDTVALWLFSFTCRFFHFFSRGGLLIALIWFFPSSPFLFLHFLLLCTLWFIIMGWRNYGWECVYPRQWSLRLSEYKFIWYWF